MGVGIAQLRDTLCGYAAGFDAAALSPGQAAHVMEQASLIEKTAAVLKALAAGRLAESDSWRAEGDRSAAHLVARVAASSVVQAPSEIDAARRLASLPETSAAARRGELSAEQVSAVVDAAIADPAVEHDLLEAARRVPLSELREQCARAKAAAVCVDPEAQAGSYPQTAVAALLHRRRRRMAPPLPQQPRGGSQDHGRPRSHPRPALPPRPVREPTGAPRRLRRRRPDRARSACRHRCRSRCGVEPGEADTFVVGPAQDHRAGRPRGVVAGTSCRRRGV